MGLPGIIEVELRDPFEILTVEPVPSGLFGPAGSETVYRIDGTDYRVSRDCRVRAPEVPLSASPALDFASLFQKKSVMPKSAPVPDPDPPPVRLRQALRQCLEAGMDTSAIEEIVRTELVDFVMSS